MNTLLRRRRLRRNWQGKMFLLHVVPMTLEHRGLSTTVDSHRSQGTGARARLEEIARVHAEGTSYDLLTRLGDPTQEILKAAKQLAADVIVMTTHGRRGFSRVLHGSVAENVIREIDANVGHIQIRDEDKLRHTRPDLILPGEFASIPRSKYRSSRHQDIGPEDSQVFWETFRDCRQTRRRARNDVYLNHQR